MSDSECVALLQWALPRLHLRWAGFRKVRRQVCRRITRRCRDLGLNGLAAYRRYLEGHREEWTTLDALCRITITRFYRDRYAFQTLERKILPDLCKRHEPSGPPIRIWSAGCASGEEPYTIALIWALRLGPCARTGSLEILATDSDPLLLERATAARYPASALRTLPADLQNSGFAEEDGMYRLRPDVAALVRFVRADVRDGAPERRRYDVILCRNLAFTYFDLSLQTRVAGELWDGLTRDGYLIVGAHEQLPDDVSGLVSLPGARGVYTRKRDVPILGRRR